MKEMGIDRTLLWPTLASVARGAHGRRSRRGVRGDPRAERVDARALDLRVLRRHLLHADHQPRGRQRRRRSTSSSTSTSAAPRSSSSASRRCPRGRAASRSRCPSSTRSGSGCRSSTSSSACTPATPATPATRTSGKASATSEMSDHRAVARRAVVTRRSSRCRRRRTTSSTRWRRSSATASPPGSRSSGSCRSSTRSRWIRPFYEKLQRTYDEHAGALRREPGRGLQPQRVGARVPRARPQGPHRPRHPGRPHHVRLRLPAPRGHGRSARLLRRSSPTSRSSSRRSSWAARSTRR